MLRHMKDVGSLIGSLVHDDSKTGELLAAVARDSERGTTSIAHLARTVRISEAKALREVNRLVEQGVVVTELYGRSRHVMLNSASPLHQPLREMLYVAYGAQEPHERRDQGWNAFVPTTVMDRIPEHLHPTSPTRNGRPFPDDDDEAGPHAAHARIWIGKLQELDRDISHLEGLLQEAYGTWHNERDRDLIHQLLPLGSGANFAVQVLNMASDHATRWDDPHQQDRHIGSKEWQLAIAAVRAEAELCQRSSDFLHQSVSLARDRARALRFIAERRERVNAARSATFAEGWRREIAEREATVDELETKLDGHYLTGGVRVRIDDVNTAGERMMVGHLRGAAEMANTYATAMETTPTQNSPQPALDPLRDLPA